MQNGWLQYTPAWIIRPEVQGTSRVIINYAVAHSTVCMAFQLCIVRNWKEGNRETDRPLYSVYVVLLKNKIYILIHAIVRLDNKYILEQFAFRIQLNRWKFFRNRMSMENIIWDVFQVYKNNGLGYSCTPALNRWFYSWCRTLNSRCLHIQAFELTTYSSVNCNCEWSWQSWQ